MVGKTISHYRILEKLGEGGMGVVYRAEDTKLRRLVALKFLPPELTRDPEAKARFIQEAQAASALDHPNICTVYEVDETPDGQLFISMAYYEGETLKDRIGRGALPPAEAARIAAQIGEGLAKAHAGGIVHRDIKPANIVLTKDGIAKILDFGLAKLTGQIGLTKASSTLGTVAYMSPEQLHGDVVDHRADIWALGVVLYEMLAGRLPFKGEYEQAMMYSIANEEAVPLESARPGTPKDLRDIVSRALAKAPGERYQHVSDMCADLERSRRLLPGESTQEAPPRTKRRKRTGLVLGVGALLVVAAIVLVRLFAPASRERPITSLAVLPFQNLSADSEQEYFSDGVTDALITELSKIGALRVISRTSVMRFKKSEESLPEIARQLNVDAIVEGSVQRVQDDVRVTAQLVRAAPEKHLWANTYTESYRNILALESDIAQTIAREIRVAVTPEEEERLAVARPVNPAAHEAYLKGRYYLNKITWPDVARAKRYFEESISIDSTYALAYVGMAEVYDYYAFLYPQESARKLPAYARKALGIDPTIAEAYALLADAEMLSWNWTGAEANFKRALALNPNDPTAHAYYAQFLLVMGRSDEALREGLRATEIDPLSAGANINLAMIYGDRREYDRADSIVTGVLSLDSSSAVPYGVRGNILVAQKRYRDAVPQYERAVAHGDSTAVGALAVSLALSGRTAEARRLLAKGVRLWNAGYQVSPGIASIYLALGERDSAFVWLEKGYERRDAMLPWIRTGKFYDPLRSDPRYVALMRKMGFER